MTPPNAPGGRCAADMRYYRPDIEGIGLLVADHRHSDHMLYYGAASTESRTAVHINAEDQDANNLLERVQITPGYAIKVSTAPSWSPALWRPLWRFNQHSQHGALILYCSADPERIGGIEEVGTEAAEVIDRGVDLLYELDQIDQEAMHVDHERRLGAVEQLLRRQQKK